MVNFTARDGLPRREDALAGVFDIHLTSDEEMWVGTEWGSAMKFDGEKFQRMMPDLGRILTPGRYVQEICQTSDGALWFGGSGGVYRYDREGVVHLTDEGFSPTPALRSCLLRVVRKPLSESVLKCLT